MWGIYLLWAAALGICDVRSRRLPDVLTIPAALLVCAAAFVWQPVALCGAVMWVGGQLVAVAMLRGSGGRYPLGGGDIKLSLSLGVLCWWAGGFFGVLLAIGASSLLSAVIMLLWRKPDLPHGPAMLLASTVVVMFGGW